MIFSLRIFSDFWEWLLEPPSRWRDVPVVWVHAGTEFDHFGPATETVIYEVIEER